MKSVIYKGKNCNKHAYTLEALWFPPSLYIFVSHISVTAADVFNAEQYAAKEASKVKVKKWTNKDMVREDEGEVKSAGITIEECGSEIMLYTDCVFVCLCAGVCVCVSLLTALINTVDVTNLPSTDRMWIQSPGAITALPLLPCLCPSVFLGSLLFFSTEIDSLTADIKERQTTGRETEICLVDATKHIWNIFNISGFPVALLPWAL